MLVATYRFHIFEECERVSALIFLYFPHLDIDGCRSKWVIDKRHLLSAIKITHILCISGRNSFSGKIQARDREPYRSAGRSRTRILRVRYTIRGGGLRYGTAYDTTMFPALLRPVAAAVFSTTGRQIRHSAYGTGGQPRSLIQTPNKFLAACIEPLAVANRATELYLVLVHLAATYRRAKYVLLCGSTKTTICRSAILEQQV